jgi:hypothetical protein
MGYKKINKRKFPFGSLTPEQIERKKEKRAQALTIGAVLLKTGFDVVETECLDGLVQEQKFRLGQFRTSAENFLKPLEHVLKDANDDFLRQAEIYYKLIELPHDKYNDCLLIIEGFLKGDVKIEDRTNV